MFHFFLTRLFSVFESKCSTWNIFSLFFLVLISSCKEKDLTPELKDSIYQDMVTQEGETTKLLTEIEKKIEDAKKAATESKPQTGELKRATAKVFEFENLKAKVQQQITFWKIRKFERLKYVRRTKPTIDEAEWKKITAEEFERYLSEKKLRQAKNAWDLKQRFKEGGFQYNPILMGEEPRTDKKKPAGGGH